MARQKRRDVLGMLTEDQVTLGIDAEGAGRNSRARRTSVPTAGARSWPSRLLGQSDTSAWRINAERWTPRGSERVSLAGAQPDKFARSLGDPATMPAIHPEREG